ncbi:hypothetical protein LR48_Vigan09g011800 [Vigna angularis]|uniref:Uncharacterized protein n=2 Tax=Phaseolus angularis TaxID=3914 RepID=A0A0L9VA14_PHAAN|nr:disease resistance protein At4g27190 [Vigna angularis]XP_017435458.1 disease resistance protein At4g27190 [Vigna angularis]XP_017435459.1 disease resistance protein At4g27190 [Vigna angularis]KOM51459.1 hypothetical protein LR48_Vigan09g011800 [Vigna angularis]BAT88911.1 hypothetical protein VIGAN_05255700 [Vigna angularis var. angularis]
MKAAVVAHQLGNLISNRSILEDLKNSLQTLQDKRQKVQENLIWEDEEFQTQSDWLKRVDEILGQGDKLLNSYEGSTCTNILLRYKVGKQSRKMQPEISVLINKGESHVSAKTRKHERPASRDETIADIMDALRNPDIQAVGVWGLGGLGTTSLAENIREKTKEQNLFDAMVFITVTDKPNQEQVQNAIANALGVQFTNGESLVKRRNKLRQRIKKEESTLIIVDDTWGELNPEEFDLEEFGVPPGNEHEGCKVFLTSGNLKFIQYLEDASKLNKVFQLEELQKEEARKLFEKKVGSFDEDQSSIVEEIVRSCEGSISLIYALAKALENKGEDALMQFKENSSPAKLLSYCLEENEEHKALLYLLAIRGRRFINSYSMYIDMWTGVFKNLETADAARKKRESLISDLKAYGLVVEKGKDWVKVDDYLYHTAYRMALHDKRASVISTEWPPEELLTDLHFCNLHPVGDLKLPATLQCPNLKHLLISRENSTIDVPDSFFEETKLLKVLDFVSFHCPKLPLSFVVLKDLEALSMYHCELGDIKEVCELTNLRMLGLLGSSIRQLPAQIVKLQKLLFLDLRDTNLQVIPPNVLSKLTSLEELYLRNSFCNWEIETSTSENKNASLKELTDLEHLAYIEDMYVPDPQAWPVDLFFGNLRSYTIFIGNGWDRAYDGDHELKTLKLKLNRRFQSENGIKKMLKEVQVLYLDTLNGVQNVVNDMECDGFPQLQSLFIQHNAEVKFIATGSGNDPLDTFPNLESLSLTILSYLEYIYHGDSLTEKSFFKLRVIKIEKCNAMRCLFSVSMINGIPHLATLEVSQCTSIKAIMLFEGAENRPIEFPELCSLTLKGLPALISFCSTEGSSSATLFHDKVSCPKLETMVISEVSELTTIWNEEYDAENSFGKLKNVIIKDCEKLRTVFPVNLSKNLDNLKTLEVRNCSLMTSIFTVMRQDSTKPGLQLSIPMIEITLTGLPKLEYVCVTTGFEALKKKFEEEWYAGLPGLSGNARIEHGRKMKKYLEEYLNM